MEPNVKNLNFHDQELGLTKAPGRTVVRLCIFDPNLHPGPGDIGANSFFMRGEGAGNWKWIFPRAFGKDEESGELDKEIATGVEDYWSRGFASVAVLADYPWVFMKGEELWDIQLEQLADESRGAVIAMMGLFPEDNVIILYTEVSNG